jgi:hypothetical protein
MTPSEREDLLARHFDGTLRADETGFDDPATYARFRGLLEIHGLLLARERTEALAPRVLETLGTEARRRELTQRVMSTLRGRRRPVRPRTPWALILAAAALLVGITVAVLARRPEIRPARPVELAPLPAPEEPVRLVREPAPPVPAKLPDMFVDTPKPPEPPRPEPPAPVAPKTEPPRPAPEKPLPRTVEVARFVPVRATAIQGAARRGTEALAPGPIERGEPVRTDARRAARIETDAGFTVWLERSSSLSVERREDGAVRVAIQAGAAFFEVAKRTAPFTAATADGEVQVVGTSFQVERDGRRTLVAVLEGSVKLRNEKGEVAVAAGQRSSARAGERPSPPQKADAEALAAWRRRPELEADPGPYVALEPGQNRRLAGLVLAAPYGDGEPESMRLARATAERLDAPLVVGQNWRDPGKRRWINVDRAMEGDVQADGTAANERFTDAARKATAEYLDRARQGAGVGPRDAVPVLIQFRNHYAPGLEAAELALSGWPRPTAAQAKAFYAQLLEKHKPAWRMELRVQGADAAFVHAEADPRVEGYMAPRNARCAAALFAPPGFGKRESDVEAYSKILGELVEFLSARRR